MKLLMMSNFPLESWLVNQKVLVLVLLQKNLKHSIYTVSMCGEVMYVASEKLAM